MQNAATTPGPRAGETSAHNGSQAERHAEQAKDKVAERREGQSGVP